MSYSSPTGSKLDPIHDATLASDIETVKRLLDEQPDEYTPDTVPQSSKRRRPLLALAAQHERSLKLGAMLIERGACVSVTDSHDFTPLHIAAQQGNLAFTTLLLQHDASVDACGTAGVTALHLAAERGHDAVIRVLLEHGADPAARDVGNHTALHKACLGQEATAETIITLMQTNKVNIDARCNPAERSALGLSVRHNRKLSELLLQLGAQTRNPAVIITFTGERTAPPSCLDLALIDPPLSLHLVSLLIDAAANNNEGEEPLHSLTATKSWSVLSALHMRGIYSPQCRDDAVECTQMLLEFGVWTLGGHIK